MAKKRSKNYIDPAVQKSLVYRIILHWLAFFLVSFFVAFCLQFFNDPFRSFPEHFVELWWRHGFVFLVMFVLLPVFAYDAIRVSNRFAGPVSRLRKTIQELANGEETQPLEFRENDFWRKLAEEFNGMVDKLRGNERAKS